MSSFASDLDLRELSNKKEYLVMASCLKKAIAESTINAQAKQLWELLWNKAKFSNQFLAQVSISEMSQWIPRSRRSIQRYIKELEKAGYLKIKANYANDKGRSASTYFVTAPQSIVAQCEKVKDRISRADRAIGPVETVSYQSEIIKETTPNDNSVTGGMTELSQQKILKNINTKKQQQAPMKVPAEPRQQNSLGAVVVDEEVEKQKAQIERLTEKRQEKLKVLDKNPSDFNLLSDFSFADSQLEQAKARLKSIFQKKQQENTSKLSIPSLPPSFSKRIETVLSQQGYSEKDIAGYLREISYETQFGSLVTNNQTQKPNPLSRSVNVALKLIREGSWSTPCGISGGL